MGIIEKVFRYLDKGIDGGDEMGGTTVECPEIVIEPKGEPLEVEPGDALKWGWASTRLAALEEMGTGNAESAENTRRGEMMRNHEAVKRALAVHDRLGLVANAISAILTDGKTEGLRGTELVEGVLAMQAELERMKDAEIERLRSALQRVWDDWCDSDVAINPEADGHETLVLVKQALAGGEE